MHLFDEAQADELFLCRIVHYLLERSPALREGLMGVINRRTPGVRVNRADHFLCVREWCTTPGADQESEGRLDLLIEMDDAVIGIETKVNAGIREDQPSKYLHSLLGRAASLASDRRQSMHAVMVLLIPEWRTAGFSLASSVRLSAGTAYQCILTWEELLQTWKSCAAADPGSLLVVSELEHLLDLQTGRRKDLEQLMPRLQQYLASSEHKEFVGWLYEAFRNDLSARHARLSCGRNSIGQIWAGYYFFASEEPWGWYGFVDPGTLRNLYGTAPVLIMGTTLPLKGLDERLFQPIPFAPKNYHEEAQYWRIRVEPAMDRRAQWRDALDPLHASASNKHRDQAKGQE